MKLFLHSSIYILAKIIPGIMAFLALSLYTHLLTPSEYGIYTLLFTGTVLLHNVLFNWLPAGTLRFWASSHYNSQTFVNTLALSYLRISVFLLIFVAIAITYYWGRVEVTWIISTYFFLLALALYTITQNLFTAKIKPQYYAYLTISYSILALSMGGTFAYLGFGATGVLAGITLGFLIPSLFVFKKIWFPFDSKFYDKALYKKLFTYGLPLASAALLEELTKVADRFMLAWLQDKSQAGLYAAGYDLAGNSILLIMSAINLAAYPVIIKLLDTKGKKVAMSYFRIYSIFLLGIAVPSVIGLNLIGPDLIYLLIDEKYYDAVTFLLPWITVAVFLMGLQAFYFDLAFQLGHNVIIITKISVVVVIINLALNYLLIPPMGIQGAAIATLVSFALGSILSAVLGRKTFTLPFPIKEFIKIIIASVLMGFCLWWLKDFKGWGWLALQLTVGSVSYLALILLFNVMDIRSHIVQALRN